MCCGFANWSILVRFGYTNNFILKIEHLLVQYLYNTKQVKLQGIGVFKVKNDVTISAESNIDGTAFTFEYDLKTTEDENLVDYIVQETRKIKPLASSDLDSYAILAKQFLNLGKPFYIEGVGTIQKNQSGFYEFIAGQFISPKIGDGNRLVKDKKDQNTMFETEPVVNNKGRNSLISLITIAIIFVSFIIYYFNSQNKLGSSEVSEQTTTLKKTGEDLKTTAILNTDKKNIDTVINIAAIKIDKKIIDSNSFRIVLKEYTTLKAVEKAYSKLTEYGHKVKIIKIDSSNYKLTMTFSRMLKDTLRVKDSLRIFFGGKPYVDKY